MRTAVTSKNRSGKASILALLIACGSFLTPNQVQAQAGPYTLSFQAFAGASQTDISITISPSPGFTDPTFADKIIVKALDATGDVALMMHYTDVELVGGHVIVSFPSVAVETKLLVQVNFKTVDSSRMNVLRADTIAVSGNVDVAIAGVVAPAEVDEKTWFDISVSVAELSGASGATFDLHVLMDGVTPVGGLTGISIGAGASLDLTVSLFVQIAGSDKVKNFTVTLINISPADSVAANNSMTLSMLVVCSPLDNDCGD